MQNCSGSKDSTKNLSTRCILSKQSVRKYLSPQERTKRTLKFTTKFLLRMEADVVKFFDSLSYQSGLEVKKFSRRWNYLQQPLELKREKHIISIMSNWLTSGLVTKDLMVQILVNQLKRKCIQVSLWAKALRGQCKLQFICNQSLIQSHIQDQSQISPSGLMRFFVSNPISRRNK